MTSKHELIIFLSSFISGSPSFHRFRTIEVIALTSQQRSLTWSLRGLEVDRQSPLIRSFAHPAVRDCWMLVGVMSRLLSEYGRKVSATPKDPSLQSFLFIRGRYWLAAVGLVCGQIKVNYTHSLRYTGCKGWTYAYIRRQAGWGGPAWVSAGD